MPARIGFEVNLGAAREAAPAMLRRSETMRLLLFGDFSGRAARSMESPADIATRPVLAIDLDNFDAVFQRLSPSIEVDIDGDGVRRLAMDFKSIDDFHPDHLYRSLVPFRTLGASRGRLLDPATSEQEAARLMAGQPPVAGGLETGIAAPREETPALLDRLLGTSGTTPARRAPSAGVVDALVRQLVAPHIQPGSPGTTTPYIAAVDATASALLRTLLRNPAFQSLEAHWRGLRRLVESVELGGRLELCLVDASKAELMADLAASDGRPEDSALHRLLFAANRGGQHGRMLLAAHYRFRADRDDLALLGHLGVTASHVGGPLLAEADPTLLGCSTFDERTEPRQWAFQDPEVERRWNELRASPAARWLGLAMPRLLLRLPYGARTDSIESFPFEEFGAGAAHEHYLWGSPALACAQVLAQAFLDDRQDAASSGPFEIDDLPVHVRDQDGERRLQACAEYVLGPRVGEEIQRRGMIPLLSHANRSSARIARLHSISTQSVPLPGLA